MNNFTSQPKKRTVEQVLKKKFKAAKLDNYINSIIYSDSTEFFESKPDLESIFEKGKCLLLENVTEKNRQKLFANLGLQLDGNSEYLFIAKESSSKHPVIYVVDSGEVGSESSGLEVEIVQSGLPKEFGKLDKGSKSDVNEKVEQSISIKQPSEEEVSMFNLEAFCEAIIRTLTTPASTVADATNQPLQAYFKYAKTYPMTIPAGQKSQGYTPAQQYAYAAITYEIYVYLNDLPGTPPFQWLYLIATGFVQPSTTSMNVNSQYHKGWFIGQLTIDVAEPQSGFIFYSNTPANTNNSKTVETSSSFTVGFDSDGGNGSYTAGTSTSKSIEDWQVVLENLNSWNFKQSSPYNGATTGKLPSGGYWYCDGYPIFCSSHGLHGLPDLSTKVFNFCTNSVWTNSHISTSTIYMRPSAMFNFRFELCTSDGTCIWSTKFTRSESLAVNLSLAAS